MKHILTLILILGFSLAGFAQEQAMQRVRPNPAAANAVIVGDTTDQGLLKWVQKPYSELASETGTVTGLTATPDSGQIIQYDGSGWVNVDLPAPDLGYREYVAVVDGRDTLRTVLVNTLGFDPQWDYGTAGAQWTSDVSGWDAIDKDRIITIVTFNMKSTNVKYHAIGGWNGEEERFIVSWFTDNAVDPAGRGDTDGFTTSSLIIRVYD